MDYIREHLQLALEQINERKEEWICDQNFDKAAAFRDAGDLIKKALKILPKETGGPESVLQSPKS